LVSGTDSTIELKLIAGLIDALVMKGGKW